MVHLKGLKASLNDIAGVTAVPSSRRQTIKTACQHAITDRSPPPLQLDLCDSAASLSGDPLGDKRRWLTGVLTNSACFQVVETQT